MMRSACLVLVVAAAAVIVGCQDTRLVQVRSRCGCECVAAPILADTPAGTQLTGEAPLTGLAKTLEAKTITLLIDDQTFGDVVKTLQIQTGLDFVIGPSAAAFAESRILMLRLVGVRVSTALNLLVTQAGEDVRWEVLDDSVVFRTGHR